MQEEKAFKLIVVLGTSCIALAVLCLYLTTGSFLSEPVAMARDRDREAVEVEQMVSASTGIWDSHPDADVGRVLQPSLEARIYQNAAVSSNRFGMREFDYEMPKPEGTVRVVLLGDSFIFGLGVEAEQRLGVWLKRALDARKGSRGRDVEVLHLGCSSWNLVAESSFLRRQLSVLQPDLVLHVSVSNDLGDTSGVRGMGAMGRFVPRRPSHADTMIKQQFSRWALDARANGHLARGVDYESRSRFDQAGEQIQRLAAAVERCGGLYLHTFHWGGVNTAAAVHLASRLRHEQVAWLPASFEHDLAVRISKSDAHWNPEGYAQMARFFYGVIRERELLPALRLAPWPKARELFRTLQAEGRDAATSPEALKAQRNARKVPSELDMTKRTVASSSTVHGGIHADGTMGPYASVVLARREAGSLRVTGACLDRPELDGGTLNIFIDAIKVASVPLRAGEPVDLSVPLPESVAERPWLSVRFVSDDYVYTGNSLRECASFILHRVAFES